MRLMWVGGNHPRHLYYVNKVRRDFEVSGALIVRRESMIPQPPDGIPERDRENFITHFKNRDEAEKKYFGKQELSDCRTLEVDEDSLNSKQSVDFTGSIKPDVVLVFGCGMIKEPLFSALPEHTINLHLGLSPRYRGSATLFWPFYFMEPAHAGSTFHYINAEPDAGDVIHQLAPKLEVGDRIHDVACKTVVASAEDAVKLLKVFERDGGWKSERQKSSGKIFLDRDFRPEHLKVIYDVFNDDVVKHYLEGNLRASKPKLIKQF